MKITALTSVLAALLAVVQCKPQNKSESTHSGHNNAEQKAAPKAQALQAYATTYFASGCFWCVEAIYQSVKGVKEVHSGYAGGTEENPTYEQVAYGRTHHAEAVEIYYDPNLVSFAQLVEVFFGSHNPTTLNRQGPDKGTQYRSIAFYKNEAERKTITDYIAQLEAKKVYNQPIVTQVKPFTAFYKAEAYHQDFEQKHPGHPYVKSVSIPRLNRFKENFTSYLKKENP